MNRWTWIALGFLILFLEISMAVSGEGKDLETLSRQKAHHQNPKFINPWLKENQPGDLFKFLKWKFSSNPYKPEKRVQPKFSVITPEVSHICAKGDSLTYLGHATYWIRLQGQNILTDPVFNDVGFLINRQTPFPLPPKELPKSDVVLISHSHYDHLNVESLQILGSRPLYLTPLGYKDWFKDVIPGARVIELDWFESYSFQGLTFRLLPAQHWSKRTLWDTNQSLWGSWLIEGEKRKVFFAGDTGYFVGIKEFGKKFGPIDAALLPIGGYEPRWFMEKYHMNPEEAVMAFLDLKAKVLFPLHWGVFDLTDEPLDLPPKALR
ncbi:MAG: MBL fold metallo-hydrolase, partial [Desulfobacca sp.]|nr:MBL fold metallo-hydrolase [Desulfobacca sp.]